MGTNAREPDLSESPWKPDPRDEWKPHNACNLGWQFKHEKDMHRFHGPSGLEKSGEREIKGVTSSSPPASADSLTPRSTSVSRESGAIG